MNRYATYEFYVEEFGGSLLKESDFDGAILKASAFLDEITFGRITDVTDDIRAAACAVAEEMQTLQSAWSASAGGTVAAEKTGDESVSYNAAGAVSPTSSAAKRLYYAAAMMYIKDKRLLERWCGTC